MMSTTDRERGKRRRKREKMRMTKNGVYVSGGKDEKRDGCHDDEVEDENRLSQSKVIVDTIVPSFTGS